VHANQVESMHLESIRTLKEIETKERKL